MPLAQRDAAYRVLRQRQLGSLKAAWAAFRTQTNAFERTILLHQCELVAGVRFPVLLEKDDCVVVGGAAAKELASDAQLALLESERDCRAYAVPLDAPSRTHFHFVEGNEHEPAADP